VQCSEVPAAANDARGEAARIRSIKRLNGGPRVSTTVVVVLNDHKRLQQLQKDLAASQPPMARLVAVGEGETALETVDRLNPSATRRRRQRAMARWLIPFGFLAGLTFTYITDLDTLAFFGPWSQHLFGALLGLGSGWMGSFAAAASVSSEEDDRLRALRNRVEEGSWLLLAETMAGADMPWQRLQQARPQMVVRLGEG
jgi:hypothetical protein